MIAVIESAEALVTGNISKSVSQICFDFIFAYTVPNYNSLFIIGLVYFLND